MSNANNNPEAADEFELDFDFADIIRITARPRQEYIPSGTFDPTAKRADGTRGKYVGTKPSAGMGWHR